jgi:hypothetical protein
MTEIENYEDISKILPEIVFHISGQKSDSASPSDTWFLKLTDSFYNGVKIDKAFLKIFMNYQSLIRITDPDLNITEPHIKAVGGVNYEILIYKNVIKNLVNKKICPNFITYLGSSQSCTYKNLLSILENAITDLALTQDEKKYVLNSIIYKCLIQTCKKRDKIDRRLLQLSNARFATHNFNNYRFGMIMTESVKSTTIKFTEYLKNYSSRGNYSELYSILFQIAAGCYSLSLSKTCHNDLHPGNIFIEVLPETAVYLYVINDRSYQIKTRYKALIYDFDRGYSKKFGANPLLEGYLCQRAFQCNSFVENQDIIKLICGVVNIACRRYREDLKNELIQMLSDEDHIQDILESSFDNSGCDFKDISKTFKREDFFSNCNGVSYIMREIYEKIDKFSFDFNKIDEDNIFVCNVGFFDNEGNIKEEIYKNVYKDTVNRIYPEKSKGKMSFGTSRDVLSLPYIPPPIRADDSLKGILSSKIPYIPPPKAGYGSLEEVLSPVIHNPYLSREISRGEEPDIFDAGENKPTNPALYNKIKMEAKKRFKKWPSAYGSAWLVKEYKKRGGTYSGKKSRSSGINRWMDEKWIDVCKLPKKVACGRPKLSMNDWKKKYPYCRPSKRINSKTPVIASKLSSSQIKRTCSIKRKSPMKRMKSVKRKSSKKSSIKSARKSSRKSARKSPKKLPRKSSKKSPKKSSKKSRKRYVRK